MTNNINKLHSLTVEQNVTTTLVATGLFNNQWTMVTRDTHRQNFHPGLFLFFSWGWCLLVTVPLFAGFPLFLPSFRFFHFWFWFTVAITWTEMWSRKCTDNHSLNSPNNQQGYSFSSSNPFESVPKTSSMYNGLPEKPKWSNTLKL